ncbi:MAG: ribose 5-phosphate isomerase B [Candidatus Margulisbacteria bacterium GWF2_35_9]|nr:MAG: ribose 5-phosphate isomerase B [Candidatus Margulisbacteria bacterium GWF2_35_9]
MKVGIGSDHAGFELKQAIKIYLEGSMKIEVVDYGTDSKESVDYPEYGFKVANAVAENEVDRGIVVCGTGIGISMAANKVKGVRAALCYDPYTAIMARKHNDANVLAIGARTSQLENALAIVGLFMKTDYEGGRHQKRVDMINNYPS